MVITALKLSWSDIFVLLLELGHYSEQDPEEWLGIVYKSMWLVHKYTDNHNRLVPKASSPFPIGFSRMISDCDCIALLQ